MFNTLRRLMTGAPRPTATALFERWASDAGHQFRRVRNEEGCVVEAQLDGQPWRAEWGMPQRDYIAGLELRLFADLPLPRDLTALVLNRALVSVMEKAVYEQYVDDVRTRTDTETPPEMRWLVLFPRLDAAELGPLKDRYAAVCSLKPWLTTALASPLGAALLSAQALTEEEDAVVLTAYRSRLALRCAFAEPDARRLAAWVRVFECLLRYTRQPWPPGETLT